MKQTSTQRRATACLLAAVVATLTPSPANGAAEDPAGPESGWLALHGDRIVRLEVARAGQTAEQRVAQASRALAGALGGSSESAVKLTTDGAERLLSLGEVPVLSLGEEDARAAGATSLDTYAATVAADLSAAVRSERRRAVAAEWVFSVSLLVFAGLIAWMLLRRLARLEAQLEDALVRVASPAVRAAFLRAARWLLQALVVWIWILFGLSLFPQSRGSAEWLLRLVLQPVADLAVRFGRSIPALIAVGVILLLALVALKSLHALFSRAAHGELSLPLVRADRAEAIGRLARASTVLVAVWLAAPLVAGGDGNAFGRLGEAALLTLALALVPLTAAALAGLPLLLGGSLSVGDQVEAGGHTGRLAAFRPLVLLLEERDGTLTAVPYLVLLFRPLRRLPATSGQGAPPP